MVYKELLQCRLERSVEATKAAIWSLNALLQTDHADVNSKPMLEASVFPVCDRECTVTLEPATSNFAIGDREHLIERFSSGAKMLDFSMEEVRRLRPFLEWLGFMPRTLSAAVEEITSASGESKFPPVNNKRELSMKAHAFLRQVPFPDTGDSPVDHTSEWQPPSIDQGIKLMRSHHTTY